MVLVVDSYIDNNGRQIFVPPGHWEKGIQVNELSEVGPKLEEIHRKQQKDKDH